MADLHPNILTYLAAIAAFNANDLRTVGDHVRSDVVYRIPGRSIGKNLDTENCYAFRFVDGKVAHGQVFVSDPDQIDDFWASPQQPAPAGLRDEPTERRTS